MPTAEGFDAEEYLIGIVGNALAELRRLPPEHHAGTVRAFLTRLNAASSALAAAGVLTNDEASAIERRASLPLMEIGNVQRVEASAEASVGMTAVASAVATGPAPSQPPAVRYRFDFTVEGLAGIGSQEREKATDAIRGDVEQAIGLSVQRNGGRLSSISYSVG